MAKTGVRVAITLACTECKRRNYQTMKSKRNTPDRVEFKKYCRWCGSHTAAPGDALAPCPTRAPSATRPFARRRSRRGAPPRGNFVQESWAELKKVEWPGQNQVIQGTVVVLIACMVVGSYLYLNDIVWKHVVAKIIGS